MKNKTAVCLAVIMIICFVACGCGNDSSGEKPITESDYEDEVLWGTVLDIKFPYKGIWERETGEETLTFTNGGDSYIEVRVDMDTSLDEIETSESILSDLRDSYGEDQMKVIGSTYLIKYEFENSPFSDGKIRVYSLALERADTEKGITDMSVSEYNFFFKYKDDVYIFTLVQYDDTLNETDLRTMVAGLRIEKDTELTDPSSVTDEPNANP